MWQKNLAIGIVGVCIVTAYALAQDTDSGENLPERYSIEERDGNIVRVDKKTGQLSICDVKNTNLVCRLGADERSAYEVEIERLGERIAVLEKHIEQSPTKTKRPSKNVPGSTRKETKLDKEFNKAMDFAETAMRRFFKMFQDLKKDFKDDVI